MVRAVSITLDGKWAVSASDYKTCILWNLQTGEQWVRFVSNSEIHKVTQFPKGIVLGNLSGEVVILKLDKELVQQDTPSQPSFKSGILNFNNTSHFQ